MDRYTTALESAYWWLVALEAGLFFSACCWEVTAAFARPTHQPWPFIASLLGAATLSLLLCHVGPAYFAARPGRKNPLVLGILAVWLGAGYIQWIGSLSDVFWMMLPGARWAAVAVAVAIAASAWAGRLWRIFLVVTLALSAGILAWALPMQWQGLWHTNPHYSGELEQQTDRFMRGLLLNAAPAVAIAWRIGQLPLPTARIWWSGAVGIWLPAVLAVGVASLASDAGANLHWHPSLPGGFCWACQGPEGLNETVVTLAGFTVIAPILVCGMSIRTLASEWKGHCAWWLAPFALYAVAAAIDGSLEPWSGLQVTGFSRPHQLWAASVLLLGAVALILGLKQRVHAAAARPLGLGPGQ